MEENIHELIPLCLLLRWNDWRADRNGSLVVLSQRLRQNEFAPALRNGRSETQY